jgi:hypothetical protein
VSLADRLPEPEDTQAIRAEAKIADVRRDRDAARQALKVSQAELASLSARLHLVEQITDLDPDPPKWLTPGKARSAHHATVTTILSDTHFDEVVNPDEIGGVNAYNRDIATLRLRRYFDQVCMIPRDYMAGVKFDGCVAMLGGDLVSGDIHEELAQTNEDSTLGTVLYWTEMIAAGIGQLADEFGKVHVPVVAGNHGRRTRKPRAKGRARDNFDWLIGHLVAREFRTDDRVTFDIPDAFFTRFPIYGTAYYLEHGDQAKGGSGWMGPLGPIMKRQTKVEAVGQAIRQPFDHMVVGHFHTYVSLPAATMNGSLKGYDEYAMGGAFGFEPPIQALWLTTPERGITMRSPIYCADPKKEKW